MNKVFGILLVGLLIFGLRNANIASADSVKLVGGFSDSVLCDKVTRVDYIYANTVIRWRRDEIKLVREAHRRGLGCGVNKGFNFSTGSTTSLKDKDTGSVYIGEIQNGLKHGQGTFTLVSGNKYVGEFKDNKYNGKGTLTLADGRVRKGTWKNNEFQYAEKPMPPESKITEKKPVQDPSKVVAAATGSGFAVSADGYVITNHHVINGCQKVFVHTNGKAIPTNLVTYDQQNDLALLKADFKPKAVFPLSNKRPELLQDIYVAGYPFGKKVSSSVKVTKGIISSLTGTNNNFARVQIDAAIQTGNSGGPILDDYGNVVGVAVSKLDVKFAIKNFGAIPENTNFGIKSSVVGSVLDSNGVDSPPANDKPITKSELGKRISKGTYYISCWMTMAQIKKMRTKKVMFSDLE